MNWWKRVGCCLLVLVGASIPAYWWLFIQSHGADPARYAIDIGEIRRLADLPAGEKPLLVRAETVAQLSAPRAFVTAGDSWRGIDLPVSSYELVYRGRVAIIDTAFNEVVARSMSASRFDQAAYARLSSALARAALIVATHEHPDHLGGLLAQVDLGRLLAATQLTHEQVSALRHSVGTGAFSALHLPPTILEGYRPLDYVRYHAVAPGVVLIKAPGHTPGSQMIYVRRADGVELLFLGDVAWRMRNVETMREKARIVTWLADEDRGKVLDELASLNRLHRLHPEIHMMPGHDDVAIKSFVKDGLLAMNFL